jgi:ABC-2 type transport system permease protein
VKQVGGICGALLTNLSAWLSGVWFDLDLVGGAFGKVADALPFVHAVQMEKALFHADWSAAAEHVLPITVYAVLTTAAAVWLFLRQMKRE